MGTAVKTVARKGWLAVALCLACTLGMAGLSACSSGGTDESAIKQDCRQMLDEALGKDVIAAAFRNVEGVGELEAFGFDVDGLAETIANLVRYEVGDVSIDGDAATAKVTLTYPDFESAELESAMQEKLEAVDVSGMSTFDEMMKAYQDAIASVLQDGNVPTASQEVDVPYERVDGTWQVKDKEAVAKQIEELTASAAS